MSNKDRQDWLKGEQPGAEGDEFARHAARGRAELGSEDEARELLNELDGMFAERFGAGHEGHKGADPSSGKASSGPQSSSKEGAAAGAKEVPLKVEVGTKVRRLGRYYAAAAAILLLVAAGSWWITRQKSVNPEFLYAEAFSPYANDLSGRTMGGDEPTSASTLDAASLAYDRGDYAAAAEGFGRYLTAPPTSTAPAAAPEKVRLYYGISLLADNQPEAAITELEALLNDPANGPPAAWYRALAQVKLGRYPEARVALRAIATDDNSTFSAKAKKLLRDLPSD